MTEVTSHLNTSPFKSKHPQSMCAEYVNGNATSHVQKNRLIQNLQCITRNYGHGCFIVLGITRFYQYHSGWFHWQWDKPNAGKAILKNMGKCITWIHKNWLYNPNKTMLHKGSHSLSWVHFNPSMDKKYKHYEVWESIAYPFPTSMVQMLKFGDG